MMIRLAQFEELKTISNLMLELFRQKMQDVYTNEGKKHFEELISLNTLEKRFLSDSSFYVCLEDKVIVGVIELEKPCHIAFLFSSVEGKGIAKSLCDKALSENTEDICTVGAFSEALGFYKKLAFIEVSNEKMINGMPFTLMAKTKPLQ